MKVSELGCALSLPVLAGEDSREITGGIFCCDLLSMVMGRAPAGCVWVTVMGNLNTLVVAMMAEVACVILAEGIRPDEAMLARAAQEGIPILCTEKPVYPIARAAGDYLSGQDI